jgi:cyclase
MSIRIIPRLDIKGPNLVKGVRFEGLRVLGTPERFARAYYEQGADELIYMDVVASLYGRNSLLDVVERTSREVFIPLTVGGGLRTVDDIRTVLRAGADKVSINTAAIERPALIREAAHAFGSSTIVVSIEAIRTQTGSYDCCTDYGRQRANRDAKTWAVEAAALGAGELIVTSIDREGTGKGFDLELLRAITRAVSIPVIAGGGAGTIDHVRTAVVDGGAQGVSVASMTHYRGVRMGWNADAVAFEGNTEFLAHTGQDGFALVQDASLVEIKSALTGCGIACRVPREVAAA